MKRMAAIALMLSLGFLSVVPAGAQAPAPPPAYGMPISLEQAKKIMVGAEAEDFARVEDVLRLMGSEVVHAGPVGAGTRFKLARNLIHFASFAAVTVPAARSRARSAPVRRIVSRVAGSPESSA